MPRLAFVPALLMACGLAAAAENSADTTAISYLNAEYQGHYAQPAMQPASFPSSGAWMSEGAAGPGLGVPCCEAGYWHDLYPVHCHRAHTLGLWDDYCTSSWHGFGGSCHGCGAASNCDDCSAAADGHEDQHVEVAPAVIDPADESPKAEEPAKEEDRAEDSDSDELESPREEPEVQVPPTQTGDEAVSFPQTDESADDQMAAEDEEAPRPDFVPVQRPDQAFPELEAFEGLDD